MSIVLSVVFYSIMFSLNPTLLLSSYSRDNVELFKRQQYVFRRLPCLIALLYSCNAHA